MEGISRWEGVDKFLVLERMKVETEQDGRLGHPLESSGQHRAACCTPHAVRCVFARQLSSTPAPSTQLASSAPHRGCRVRPCSLFCLRHCWIRSAKPAAGDARARRSSQNMTTQPQQRAAACGREQAPHRRVDEVAHAGHQHPRYERLGKQQEYTGVNGNILSHIANPVISERKKTIGIFAIQNSTKII